MPEYQEQPILLKEWTRECFTVVMCFQNHFLIEMNWKGVCYKNAREMNSL